jgi:hypothetical protein
MKHKLCILLLGLLVLALTACQSEPDHQTGKLVGVEMSIGLSDVADGVIDRADFGGIVIVELEDGTEVKAIWDKSLGSEVAGGMVLEIAPTDDPDYWRVVQIIETP